jgi:NTP pyrophosphatase (non-canonical NTP hydrolase)
MVERDFDELKNQVCQFHEKRTSMGEYNKLPGMMEMSLVLEAAEVLELTKFGFDGDKEKYASELADLMIYLMVLSDNKGIDLFEATLEKVKKNEERFPVENFQGTAEDFPHQYWEQKKKNGERK